MKTSTDGTEFSSQPEPERPVDRPATAEAARYIPGAAWITDEIVSRKRLTDQDRKQQRLLNGYLAGLIKEEAFIAQSDELKLEAERLRQPLADAEASGRAFDQTMLDLFEFLGQ